MTSTYCRTELIGRLGQDPEFRYLESGRALARLRVATDRPSRNGAEPETDWHTVVCWDKLAEFAVEYLTTGRLIFVAGRLAYRTYDGRDGQKHRLAEIVAGELFPLDRRPDPSPAAGDDLVDAAPHEGQAGVPATA